MAKTFVAINDPVHRLLRELTGRLPLQLDRFIGTKPLLQYQFRAEDLPESYYSLARFHTLEGMSSSLAVQGRWRVKAEERSRLPEQVNYFDLTRLDRRCCRDLRLKLRRQGPGMLSADSLTFGTGALRARNDDPAERVHQYLWSAHGRLQTRHETIHATIRALHLNSMPLWNRNGKESFDSTNVIYGDAYGELEQLWERRADTAFLEHVAHSLQAMCRKTELAAFLPPLNLAGVIKLHLKSQAIWRTPPASARALLRRLDYILSHTIVDNCPQTVFRRPEPELRSAPRVPASPPLRWESDRSGYDGWLSGN
jgi:hypothetical protein